MMGMKVCVTYAHTYITIYFDSMNSCVAIQNGRSQDHFMQSCIRTIFLISEAKDTEALVCHNNTRVGVRCS